MLSGRDGLGESRMWEICMSGSTREREAAVIGLCAFHSVLSSLLYWPFLFLLSTFCFQLFHQRTAAPEQFNRRPRARSKSVATPAREAASRKTGRRLFP